MPTIVEYQYDDMCREAEREFVDLHEALRFADACIENGGSASVHTSEMLGYLPPHLCDVFLTE